MNWWELSGVECAGFHASPIDPCSLIRQYLRPLVKTKFISAELFPFFGLFLCQTAAILELYSLRIGDVYPGGMRHAKGKGLLRQWGGVWNTQPGFKPWSVMFPQKRLKTCFTISFVSDIRICHHKWASETVAGAGDGNWCESWAPPSKPEHFFHSGFHGCCHPVPHVQGKSHEVYNLHLVYIPYLWSQQVISTP